MRHGTSPSPKLRLSDEGQELRRILIVDDEPNMRFLVRVTLEQAGYAVLEAQHGAAALGLATESPPDVVITDLMMPVMGGRELIDRLRSNQATASIPIIVLSANGRLRVGDADVALDKPFELDELLEHVRALSELKEATE